MLYRGISDRTDLGAFEVTDAVTGAPATRAHIGSVRLTLEPGGATRGRFIARIRQLDGVLDTLDVDLGGRWTRSGDTVRLAHDADTFLRDLPFVARDGLLTGENVFSGVRVRVVLVRP
jgi:hypothetical protein